MSVAHIQPGESLIGLAVPSAVVDGRTQRITLPPDTGPPTVAQAQQQPPQTWEQLTSAVGGMVTSAVGTAIKSMGSDPRPGKSGALALVLSVVAIILALLAFMANLSHALVGNRAIEDEQNRARADQAELRSDLEKNHRDHQDEQIRSLRAQESLRKAMALQLDMLVGHADYSEKLLEDLVREAGPKSAAAAMGARPDRRAAVRSIEQELRASP